MKQTKLFSAALVISIMSLGAVSWAEPDTITDTQPEGTKPASGDAPSTRNDQYQQRHYVASRPDATDNLPSCQPQRVNKASNLIGMDVKNQAGEKLGIIKELVVDFNSGKVAYCVLASDAGVFRPGKLHAVPLNALQQSPDGTFVTMNADKEKLARAEGFDRNNWPALTTPTWGADSFWQEKPENRTDTDKEHNATDQERRDKELQAPDKKFEARPGQRGPDYNPTPDETSQSDQQVPK